MANKAVLVILRDGEPTGTSKTIAFHDIVKGLLQHADVNLSDIIDVSLPLHDINIVEAVVRKLEREIQEGR